MAALAPIPRRMLPLSCTVRTEEGAAFLLDGVGLEYEQAVSDDAHRSADAGGGTAPCRCQKKSAAQTVTQMVTVTE